MKKYIFLYSSIILHGLLIMGIALVWHPREVKTLSKNTIQSYVYQNSFKVKQSISREASQERNSDRSRAFSASHLRVIVPRVTAQKARLTLGWTSFSGFQPAELKAFFIKKSVSTIQRNEGRMNYIKGDISKDKNHDEPLIKILHDAIANVQHYPEIAIALNQSGSVTIGFRLYPNGRLSEIKLEKSSGFDRLDQAALSAAHSIVMVQEAKQYITNPRYYAIEVQFTM